MMYLEPSKKLVMYSIPTLLKDVESLSTRLAIPSHHKTFSGGLL